MDQGVKSSGGTALTYVGPRKTHKHRGGEHAVRAIPLHPLVVAQRTPGTVSLAAEGTINHFKALLIPEALRRLLSHSCRGKRRVPRCVWWRWWW